MYNKKNCIFITFHGIGEFKIVNPDYEDGEEKVWISAENFVDICKLKLKRDDVFITFDDGNLSDFEIAFPELLDKNIKATFFIVASRIGEQHFLNSDHLKLMKKNGMEIGIHGMNHKPWRGLSDEDLNIELSNSKEILENVIGDKIYSAACPFGQYNKKVIKKLKDLGFMNIYTSDGGVADNKNIIKHRNTIHFDENAAVLENKIKKYYSNASSRYKRDLKCIIKSRFL